MMPNMLALVLAAQAGALSAAQAAPPPLAYAEFAKACISTGGMAGYAQTLASADLYQLSTPRLVELTLWADNATTGSVAWQPIKSDGKPGTALTTPLTGSTSMAFNTTFAKLNFSGEGAWCVRVR